MGNIPLHPLVVHFPLVLAVLLPIVLLALVVASKRGMTRDSIWWVGVVTAAILVVSAVVALKTGERDEEAVERVVAEQYLERHEERADLFLWIAVGTLVLTFVTATLRSRRAHSVLAAASIISSLAAAGSAVAVGHSGGSLVYEHNAGVAHSRSEPAIVGQRRESTNEEGGEDDEHHAERRR